MVSGQCQDCRFYSVEEHHLRISNTFRYEENLEYEGELKYEGTLKYGGSLKTRRPLQIKVNKDLNQWQKNVACPELGTAQPQLVLVSFL